MAKQAGLKTLLLVGAALAVQLIERERCRRLAGMMVEARVRLCRRTAYAEPQFLPPAPP